MARFKEFIKNKKMFIIVITILTIFTLLIIVTLKPLIIPVIKFISPYEIPDNMTAEETISYFFECAKDNNPGKANKLLYDPFLGIFSCNSIETLELKEIIKVGTNVDAIDADYFEVQDYLVTYKCKQRWYDGHKLFAAGEDQSSTIMHLIKESPNSAWEIYSWTG